MEPVAQEPEVIPSADQADQNLQQETQEMTVAAHDPAGAPVKEKMWEDPTFWVALAFFIFVAIAAKYVWPAMRNGLDNRALKIKDQLDAATKLRVEAEQLLKQYEKQQKQALKEAEEILENAKRDAKTIRDNAAKDLKVGLERRAAQAEENIARAEQDAIRQLRTQLVDNATEIARGVVKAQLEGQKDDPSIGRALTAIERQIA